MKKKLILISFILIIIFFYWRIFISKASAKNRIPNYADSIISFDYQNIRNTLISYYLFNPSDYFSKFNSNNNDSLTLFNSGLEIPYYFTVFTCSKNCNNTLFSTLNINDKIQFDKFITYIKSEKNAKKINSNTNYYYQFDKYIVGFNNDKTIFSGAFTLSKNKESIITVMEDIFSNNNLLSQKSKSLTSIKKSDSHGLIWIAKGEKIDKESIININFNEGIVNIDGDLFLKEEYDFNYTSTNFNSDSSLAYLFFNGNKSKLTNDLYSLVNKAKFNKLTNINIDSLISYSNKSFYISLLDYKTSYDTNITYEYDDNFSKVEKVSTTETKTPSFELVIPSKNNLLYKYLIRDSIAKIVGNKLVFTPYPLTKTYTYPNNGLTLSSLSAPISKPMESQNFLQAYINISKIDSNLINYPHFREQLEKLNTFSFVASQKENFIKIIGKIDFKNEDKNSLIQIIDN